MVAVICIRGGIHNFLVTHAPVHSEFRPHRPQDVRISANGKRFTWPGSFDQNWYTSFPHHNSSHFQKIKGASSCNSPSWRLERASRQYYQGPNHRTRVRTVLSCRDGQHTCWTRRVAPRLALPILWCQLLHVATEWVCTHISMFLVVPKDSSLLY